MRNPFNPNQELYMCSSFNGYPVQTKHGALVTQYLVKLNNVFIDTMQQHSRTFAVRVDLRFSRKLDVPDIARTNKPITSFLRSLESKLNHRDLMTRKNKGRCNPHGMRYAWAREIGADSGVPHYHLILFFNGDAYRSLGNYSDPEKPSLYRKMQEAWANAIGIPFDLADGLVSLPDRGQWMLRRGDHDMAAQVFYAASYLCKASSKVYELGFHGFDCSRPRTIPFA